MFPILQRVFSQEHSFIPDKLDREIHQLYPFEICFLVEVGCLALKKSWHAFQELGPEEQPAELMYLIMHVGSGVAWQLREVRRAKTN